MCDRVHGCVGMTMRYMRLQYVSHVHVMVICGPVMSRRQGHSGKMMWRNALTSMVQSGMILCSHLMRHP